MTSNVVRRMVAIIVLLAVVVPSYTFAAPKAPPVPSTPVFKDASVHDPSVIKVDDTY